MFNQDYDALSALSTLIDDAETEIQELENSVKQKVLEIKSALRLEVFKYISSLNGVEQKQVASFIYWNCGPLISAETISRAIGLKNVHALYRWVLPETIRTKCIRCGQYFDSPLSSRTSLFSNSTCPNCDKRWMDDHFKGIRDRENQIENYRAMPYYNYLKTEHWKTVRTAALKRAKFRCQVCNSGDKKLHVHHRTYEHLGEEWSSDLIVLCEDCHKTFHENGKLSKE